MRKLFLALPATALLFVSCKSFMYRTPPVNAPVFANKGEVQAAADAGTMGWTAKGGVSLTDHIALESMFTGPISTSSYKMKETEFGIGLYRNKPDSKRGNALCIYVGYAWGNNSKLDSGAVLKDFFGDYNRVFLQVGGGSTKSTLFSKIQAGGLWAVKFNYMTYYGQQSYGNSYIPFWGSSTYMETYFAGTIGGKHIRLEYGTGFPLKLDFKWAESNAHNIRIFPLHFNVGLQIILGRHYD